jgi:hypothetical protein
VEGEGGGPLGAVVGAPFDPCEAGGGTGLTVTCVDLVVSCVEAVAPADTPGVTAVGPEVLAPTPTSADVPGPVADADVPTVAELPEVVTPAVAVAPEVATPTEVWTDSPGALGAVTVTLTEIPGAEGEPGTRLTPPEEPAASARPVKMTSAARAAMKMQVANSIRRKFRMAIALACTP